LNFLQYNEKRRAFQAKRRASRRFLPFRRRGEERRRRNAVGISEKTLEPTTAEAKTRSGAILAEITEVSTPIFKEKIKIFA